MKTILASVKTTPSIQAIRFFIIVSILISGLIGCGGQGPSVSISSTPETILLGQSSVLNWSSQGADSVSINNGVGTVEHRGTKVVTPFRTTTYTISAVNADGKAESSVTVNVVHSQGTPTVSIKATPMTIHTGGESVLAWSTGNAYSVIIDNGIGNVPLNYSRTVRPGATTTYTISAIGPGGTSTASVTINVIPSPPSANITANPTSIKPGETTLVEWSYANAHTVTIEPGIGDGTQLKSVNVSPDKTTTYSITAFGPGGTATARVTVIVSEVYNPLKAHIEADPTQIYAGESATLIWKTHNASKVWIEPDIGDVQLNGSITVSPLKTTTYVIHASQNGEVSMDSVTINVISNLPEVSIVADPESIKLNESSILTWQTKNAYQVEIDQNIGEVDLNGSIEVSPSTTTIYTIKATGIDSFVTASVTVKVVDDIQKRPLGNQHFSYDHAKNIDILDSYRLSVNFSPTSNTLLPEKIDWSYRMPAIKSQGETGSGNAWAMVYYLKSFQESIEKQCQINESLFGPMLTYVLQCRTGSRPWDIIQTWSVMHRFGTTLDDRLPFKDLDGFMDSTEIDAYSNYSLNDLVMDEALNYKTGTPVLLTTLDQIQMSLTQSPVILAINHYDPEKPENEVTDEHNFLVYDANCSELGHAVLCIGYDNERFGVGALQFINSWGDDWARNGISWIKYPDMKDIIVASMSLNDLPNKLSPMENYKRPSIPHDVQASDNTMPFVDISWTHVNNARYYKIFRAPAQSLSTTHEIYDYEWIGSSYHSPFRDYSYAGDTYLYAVVAVNEFGESDLFNHQNHEKSYIDQGMANGKMMATPILSLIHQSSGSSEYGVASIANSATRLHVFVSHNESGPWQSLGWIKPVNQFMINWQKDGTWTGYKPYVRVIAENPEQAENSQPSQAIQVSSSIEPLSSVAGIEKLDAFVSDVNSIHLSWQLTNSNADHLDIWRTHEMTTTPVWIKIDTITASLKSYHDGSAISGIPYYYAIYSVFEGVSGMGKQTDQAVQLPLDQPNLKISHVEYDTGPLMEPLEMELTIQNNGNAKIEDYKFKIIAYNWSNHKLDTCLEDSISNYTDLKLPMLSGNQHVFTVTFDLPAHISREVIFSWYIMIDSDNAIEEAYEEDNIFWAQKMCWMDMNKQ